MNIRPRRRVLVKMISVQDDHIEMMGPALRTAGLVTIDRKKHWDHVSRRGIVQAIDPRIETEVEIGDVVIFNGAAGFTLDGDVLDQDFDDLDQKVRGEGYRWLRAKEIEAIDLLETEKRKQTPVEEPVHA